MTCQHVKPCKRPTAGSGGLALGGHEARCGEVFLTTGRWHAAPEWEQELKHASQPKERGANSALSRWQHFLKEFLSSFCPFPYSEFPKRCVL